MLQGLSANADMSDGTANNLVTNDMSLTLKSQVKTLMNIHITHTMILISISLDKDDFCRKNALSIPVKLF